MSLGSCPPRIIPSFLSHDNLQVSHLCPPVPHHPSSPTHRPQRRPSDPWCDTPISSRTMASIDRWRPSREGYQPPSLPPKPVARLSKSPSGRRDVPPAVPSPPTHSSRTSSLPPQSRRGNPSPAHPSPTSASRPRASQWYFTPEEALSSPSVLDGLTPADERLRRAKGVNFIYQAGAMIELPQTTLWVAATFFHRFYMRCSMVDDKGGIHHYVRGPVAVLQPDRHGRQLLAKGSKLTPARPSTRTSQRRPSS